MRPIHRLLCLCLTAFAAGGAAAQTILNPNLLVAHTGRDSLLLGGSDSVILRANHDCQAWQTARVPTDEDSAGFAATSFASSANGQLLIASGHRPGLWRSNDAGASWQALPVIQPHALRSVVFEARSRQWIAAGDAGSLLRGDASGQTWEALPGGWTATISQLIALPDGSVLAGGEDGLLLRSTDAGDNWTQLEAPTQASITRLFALPGGKHVFALDADGRILRSTNGGRRWLLAKQPLNPEFLAGIATSTDQRTLLAWGSNGRVLRSADLGASWQAQRLPEANNVYFSSALLAGQRWLLLGSGGELYQADASARRWQRLPQPGNEQAEGMLACSDGRILQYGAGGLLRLGQLPQGPWQTLSPGLTPYVHDAAWLADQQTLVAVGAEGWIMRSEDRGQHWHPVSAGLAHHEYLLGLTLTPAQSLIAVGPPGNILRSTDRGQNWQKSLSLDNAELGNFQKVISSGPQLVTIGAPGGIWHSADDGRHWQDTGVPAEHHLFDVIALPRQHLVAIGAKGVILQSRDGGKRWQAIKAPTQANLYGLHHDSRAQRTWIAGERGTLLYSDDLGSTWQTRASGSTQALRHFAASPDGSALLAVGGGGSILQSRDGGNTWQAIASGTDHNLRAPLVVGKDIYLPTRGGLLLRSSDQGQSWQKIATGSQRPFKFLLAGPDQRSLLGFGERLLQLSTPALP
jgi:photosystem II stability/assembly factor-like uncharacterized protein